MITRLILSLKKAANSLSSVSSSAGQPEAARFLQHTVGGIERVGGDMALRDLPGEGTSSLPRSDDQI